MFAKHFKREVHRLLESHWYPKMFIFSYWEQALKGERYQDPKNLVRYGSKSYSQNDEDGIISEIFNRIGSKNKNFIEIGVAEGLENNTLNLLVNGWTGTWFEISKEECEKIGINCKHFLSNGSLKVINQKISPNNINQLLENVRDQEIDLFSIDIDGNDFWVWKALTAISPRVVVIEYNATWRPPSTTVMEFDDNYQWDGSNYTGTSLKALEKLGHEKGYNLVACNFSGVNAFFVRKDLCGDNFLEPFTAEKHYEPARYFFSHVPSGHHSRVGPVIQY